MQKIQDILEDGARGVSVRLAASAYTYINYWSVQKMYWKLVITASSANLFQI